MSENYVTAWASLGFEVWVVDELKTTVNGILWNTEASSKSYGISRVNLGKFSRKAVAPGYL